MRPCLPLDGRSTWATPAGHATLTLVAVLAPAGVKTGDANVHVTETPGTEQENVIGCVNPPVASMVNGTDADEPAVIDMELEPGDREKPGSMALT